MHDHILVEREGFAFIVGIKIERMPLFCSHCTVIGHSVDHCKFSKKNVAHSNPGPPTNQVVILGRRGAMKYVPKQKEVVVDLDANHADPRSSSRLPQEEQPRHPSRSPTQLAILLPILCWTWLTPMLQMAPIMRTKVSPNSLVRR